MAIYMPPMEPSTNFFHKHKLVVSKSLRMEVAHGWMTEGEKMSQRQKLTK